MTAGDDIFERRNPRLHESLVHILSHISRRRAVERQVSAFRADDELLARNAVLVREYLQGFADGAFASLETIVGGGVDNVDPKLHSANNRARVALISGLVRIAEICADADRRKYESVLIAEVIWREAISEALAGLHEQAKTFSNGSRFKISFDAAKNLTIVETEKYLIPLF